MQQIHLVLMVYKKLLKMRSKSKAEKIAGIVLGGGFLLVVIYGTINSFITRNKFDSDSIEKKITNGSIIEYNSGAKSPPDFEYEFYVNGQQFIGRYLIVTKLRQKSSIELKKYIGRKYKVLYVVDDPNYSKLLFEQPVHDSVPLTK